MQSFRRSLISAVPSSYGSIRKISVPPEPSGQVVIHILDVHRNMEAQENIHRILSSLIGEGAIKFIAMEGAFSEIDLSDFRSFPDSLSVLKAAEFLFKEKKISGPVFTALTSQATVPLIGVDDRSHYTANVEAVRQSAHKRNPFKHQLLKQKKRLNEDKARTLNPALARFDQFVNQYRDGDMNVGEYLKLLAGEDVAVSPTISAFLRAQLLEESISLTQAESDRSRLFSRLISQLSPEQRSKLLQVSMSHKKGRIDHVEYYGTVQNLCRDKGIKLDQYPALNSYLRYLFLSASIEPAALFVETKNLENEIYASLAQTEDEKRLIEESKGLYLAERLVDFSLTHEEWREYKSWFDRDPVSNQKASGFGSSLLRKNFLVDNLKSFESFYREAEIRDQKMAENLLAHMERLNDNVQSPRSAPGVIVLVAGGFHSHGINQALLKKGVTVVSIVPTITKVDTTGGTAYLSVFTQQKSPLDTLFEGQTLFLSEEVMDVVEDRTAKVLTAASAIRTGTVDMPAVKTWLRRALQWNDLFIDRVNDQLVRIRHRFGKGCEVRFNRSSDVLSINTIAAGTILSYVKNTWGSSIVAVPSGGVLFFPWVGLQWILKKINPNFGDRIGLKLAYAVIFSVLIDQVLLGSLLGPENFWRFFFFIHLINFIPGAAGTKVHLGEIGSRKLIPWAPATVNLVAAGFISLLAGYSGWNPIQDWPAYALHSGVNFMLFSILSIKSWRDHDLSTARSGDIDPQVETSDDNPLTDEEINRWVSPQITWHTVSIFIKYALSVRLIWRAIINLYEREWEYLKEVTRQIVLSNINFEMALQRIRLSHLTRPERHELERNLKYLYRRSLPIFAKRKSVDSNPVYHHTQVLDNMIKIANGEKLGYSEYQLSVFVALLHDIGNAICTLEKSYDSEVDAIAREISGRMRAIREMQEDPERAARLQKEIDDSGLKGEKKLDDLIHYRLEHAIHGIPISSKLLRRFFRKKWLTAADRTQIALVILQHDYPTIQGNVNVLSHALEGKVRHGPGAFLIYDGQFGSDLFFRLREADRLFMLSVQGVIKDVQTDNLKIRKKNREQGLADPEKPVNVETVKHRGRKNLDRHREEYQLYVEAGMDDGGFRNNESLYRTAAGYSMFKSAENKFGDPKGGILFLPWSGFKWILNRVRSGLGERLGARLLYAVVFAVLIDQVLLGSLFGSQHFWWLFFFIHLMNLVPGLNGSRSPPWKAESWKNVRWFTATNNLIAAGFISLLAGYCGWDPVWNWRAYALHVSMNALFEYGSRIYQRLSQKKNVRGEFSQFIEVTNHGDREFLRLLSANQNPVESLGVSTFGGYSPVPERNRLKSWVHMAENGHVKIRPANIREFVLALCRFLTASGQVPISAEIHLRDEIGFLFDSKIDPKDLFQVIVALDPGLRKRHRLFIPENYASDYQQLQRIIPIEISPIPQSSINRHHVSLIDINQQFNISGLTIVKPDSVTVDTRGIETPPTFFSWDALFRAISLKTQGMLDDIWKLAKWALVSA